MSPVPVAVFASGSGTNLQALLDHEGSGAEYRVELLVTDRECGAEERASRHGRSHRRIPFAGREPVDVTAEVLDALEAAGARAVFLAGFLRLVPEGVVDAFPRRILNVHPALLPAFGGKGMYGIRVHEAVLASGAKVSGPTVHYVDAEYDEGTILAQWPVPVLPRDTAASLAARVLVVEHVLFPTAADALVRAIRAESAPSFTWPGSAAADAAPSPHIVRKAFGISS